MDSQLKKGLLEICVLAALAKQDSYGYQIIKDVSLRSLNPHYIRFLNAWKPVTIWKPIPSSITAGCVNITG